MTWGFYYDNSDDTVHYPDAPTGCDEYEIEVYKDITSPNPILEYSGTSPELFQAVPGGLSRGRKKARGKTRPVGAWQPFEEFDVD